MLRAPPARKNLIPLPNGQSWTDGPVIAGREGEEREMERRERGMRRKQKERGRKTESHKVGLKFESERVNIKRVGAEILKKRGRKKQK